MRAFLISLITGLGALLPVAAHANDGYIEFGGSPKLLTRHPSVRMESELVRMTVGQKTVVTDCRFVFRNEGPACTVRIGFPDQGEGAGNPDEEGPKNPPKGTFLSFRSWVDGHPYRTRVVRAGLGKFWHAKTVYFPAHSRRTIRDLYTARAGLQVTSQGSYHGEASYILHTGSSWHGRIGRTEVRVTFRRKRMRTPFQVYSTDRFDPDQGRWAEKYHRIYYTGPGRPRVRGTSLTWVRTNWRPRDEDDIQLYFDNGPEWHEPRKRPG